MVILVTDFNYSKVVFGNYNFKFWISIPEIEIQEFNFKYDDWQTLGILNLEFKVLKKKLQIF